MASLGRFGVEHDTGECDTFEFFEVEPRVNPSFGELDLTDFLEAASVIEETDISKAMSLIKNTLRAMVHPDDFDDFWATAKRHRQGTSDLMGLMYAVIETAADRPTEQPADSSDGLPLTSTSSSDDSSSRVIHRLEQEGRPSLALMVQQAQERGSRASA